MRRDGALAKALDSIAIRRVGLSKTPNVGFQELSKTFPVPAMTITLRDEEPADCAAIHALVAAASGQAVEADLVD